MCELSPLTWRSFRPQISEPHKSIGLIWASNILRNIDLDFNIPSLTEVSAVTVMTHSFPLERFLSSPFFMPPRNRLLVPGCLN